MRREIGDEAQHRVADLGQVAGLVGLEPRPLVVELELAQELKQCRAEMGVA